MEKPIQQEPSSWAWDTARIIQLGVLTFARLCLNTLLRIVYPFAPAFARGLGVPVTVIYLIISARNLIGLFSPLFASLPERFGRRVVMTVSLVLFGITTLLVAFYPSIWTFGLAIVLLGVLKVTYDPAMQSYLGDAVPYDQRGRALAVTELAWSGGFLLGAPLTGWLIAQQGWNTPFLWLGISGLIAAVLLWQTLPSARKHARDRVGLFYVWQMLQRHPIIWAAALFMMLVSIAHEILFIVYGDWMEVSFSLTLTSLGLATTLIGLAEMTGEATAGWSTDRFGKRPVVIVAGLLNIISYLIIPFSDSSLPFVLTMLVILFYTYEITIVGTIPLLSQLVPPARIAVMSMSLGAMAAGRTIGSLVGPLVWERTGMIGNSFLAAAFMLLGILVLYRWLHESKEVLA